MVTADRGIGDDVTTITGCTCQPTTILCPCLSFCLSDCLFVCLSVCLFDYPSVGQFQFAA